MSQRGMLRRPMVVVSSCAGVGLRCVPRLLSRCRSGTLWVSSASFSTIQRGHDRQVEDLYEKLGLGKDKEAHRIRRTIAELEQSFVRQVQLLNDPLHNPADAARLEQLKEAYVLLRDDNFRRNYTAHYHNSNDAQLHVLVDGGAVAANFNPEHQSFEFVDHAMLRKDAGRSQNESLSSGSGSGGGGGGHHSASSWSSSAIGSTSFASTEEAYRNATGLGPSADTAKPYNAADARTPINGADIAFLLKLSFEESLLGCSKQLRLLKHTHCPLCNAMGTQQPLKATPDSARRCPQCLGRGSVHLPSATYHIERKCNYCAGEGTVPPPRCVRCRGRGVLLDQPVTVSVVVPPGTFSGTVFRLKQKGHDGVRGGRTGDLVLTVMAAEHRHFHRVGAELHAMLPLPLSTALLGGVVLVPTIGSSDHDSGSSTVGGGGSGGARGGRPVAALRVPPCVRNGDVLGLRQHMVRSGGGEGRLPKAGEMSETAASSSRSKEQGLEEVYYHVLVLVPRAESLTGRQKAALRAYETATRTAQPRSAEASCGVEPPQPQQSQDGAEGESAASTASPSINWETDVSQEAVEARLEQCAHLKSKYKHWLFE